jgi:hypothetical protein
MNQRVKEITPNVMQQRVVPIALGFTLLLSISTNLRLAAFPVGPGELLLALLAAVGVWFGKPLRLWKTPVVLFWICAGFGMVLGAALAEKPGASAGHHAMAYVFTGAMTVGLIALLVQLSDAAVRRSIFWLSTLTAVILWFGFMVYLSGDTELAKQLYMADGGDIRYSGWSINPNQLALFFVPLPVWVAALWRDVTKPTRLQMASFGLLLFALMLMGLLVRSDGLFVVWVFEFVILIMLRLRWEMKASRMSLLGYALVMVLCVFLVRYANRFAVLLKPSVKVKGFGRPSAMTVKRLKIRKLFALATVTHCKKLAFVKSIGCMACNLGGSRLGWGMGLANTHITQ